MTIWTVLLFLLGLALLIAGAELLVRGAARLAAISGVSPLVVGLTVVAWGTGSPELAVCIKSTFTPGQSDVAIGNIVGSNIANILFILGAASIASPLIIAPQLVRLDVPLMIGASLLLWLLSLDGTLGTLDGVIFLVALTAYTIFSVVQSRKESKKIKAEFEAEFAPPAVVSMKEIAIDIGSILLGLGLLVLGAEWLVQASITIAEALGVSQLVIGLTVVAVGTSMPEAATSMMAALRGHRDIAVGNAVGSNIFNILAVLGATALVTPGGIVVSPAAITFDMPVMIGVAVACLPIFFSGRLITRTQGILFVCFYIAYLTHLVLHETKHHLHDEFSTAMLWFVLPITSLSLLIMVVRHIRLVRHEHSTVEKIQSQMASPPPPEEA